MIENFKFNKKFGQNFISDLNLLNAIANDAGVTENDDVLEIGAGAGSLTSVLARNAKKVVSYEIDKNLTEHLKEIENNNANLKIVMQDALKMPINEIEKDFNGEYKLVANLPYYITSPLIFKFLEETNKCTSLTVMVQKEVAERFSAKTGTKEYGIPSIMISAYGNIEIKRIVSRKMFFPMPNVDSAIIRIDRNPKYNVNLKKLKKVVSAAFSMRRKTLINNLTSSLGIKKENAVEILNSLNISETARAEELNLLQFIELSKIL